MTSKHTPTPWQDTGTNGDGFQVIKDAEDCLVAYVFPPEANAARIVRCVNTHDELVAALERIAAMDPMHSQAAYLAKSEARAALAKVTQ